MIQHHTTYKLMGIHIYYMYLDIINNQGLVLYVLFCIGNYKNDNSAGNLLKPCRTLVEQVTFTRAGLSSLLVHLISPFTIFWSVLADIHKFN